MGRRSKPSTRPQIKRIPEILFEKETQMAQIAWASAGHALSDESAKSAAL